MRILHTADWHIGKIVNGYNLLSEQANILRTLKDIIISNNIDVILLSGDIYDRSIPSYDAMQVFEDFINEMIITHHKKVILIIGNHDGKRLGFGSQLLREKGFYIFNEPGFVMLDGVAFYAIPYLSIYDYREIYQVEFKDLEEAYQYIIDKWPLDKGTYNVLLAHDYFTYHREELITSESEMGIMCGGSTCVDVTMFKDFNYVALGHMHASQKVGFEHIRYSGSIMKYSFGEANHQKGVNIIDTYQGCSKIPLLPNRDMVVIKGKIEELTAPEFYTKYQYQKDFFKAIITNQEEIIDAYAKLKCIYPFLMEIYKETLDSKANATKENVINLSKRELFDIFYREVTGNDLTDAEKEVINNYLGEEDVK